MKSFYNVLKVLAVIAAIVGIIFLIATYGDRIVSWFKRLLGKKRFQGECDDMGEDDAYYYEGDDTVADADFDE